MCHLTCGVIKLLRHLISGVFLAMSPEEDGGKSGRPVEMDDLAGFARRLSSVIVFPPLRRRSVPFSPVHWLGGKIAEF
jgi:hypothetical protein